jgi:hypothetical protein
MTRLQASATLGLSVLLLAGCEATANAHGRDSGVGSATAADPGCHSDAECVVDFRPVGACCRQCEPRASTRAAQKAQDTRCSGVRCADPACAPPRNLTLAACVQGRCTLRQESNQ